MVEGLIFQKENFGFGLMSKIRLLSYSAQYGPNGGQPSDFLCPSMHLILIDQIFVHKLFIGESSIDFERLFKICDNNTRQGTFQKLVLPDWDLQFSKHKLSYRAVLSFNLLPLEARQMTLQVLLQLFYGNEADSNMPLKNKKSKSSALCQNNSRRLLILLTV